MDCHSFPPALTRVDTRAEDFQWSEYQAVLRYTSRSRQGTHVSYNVRAQTLAKTLKNDQQGDLCEGNTTAHT